VTKRQGLDSKVREAIKHFWLTRSQQALKQGSATGAKDAGARAAVTGGAQMDGFVFLVREILGESGLQDAEIHCSKHLELPGWYRAEKKWDLLVVSEGQLMAAVEFKSQIGPSFGNNFNNRTEEAIGSASDLWAAYREGAFKPSSRPWLGYLMLLEDTASSNSAVSNRQPHFEVFPEFRLASYAQRYQVLLSKLIRERMYDSACFLMSDAQSGVAGNFTQPDPELTFDKFADSLRGRALAWAAGRRTK
jgi:hypothetical protein